MFQNYCCRTEVPNLPLKFCRSCVAGGECKNHLKTNFTERVNQTVKVMISSYVFGEHNHCDHYLPELKYAINSAVQESTGYSPAELLLQRRLKGPFEHALEPHQTSLRVLKDLQDRVKKELVSS